MSDPSPMIRPCVPNSGNCYGCKFLPYFELESPACHLHLIVFYILKIEATLANIWHYISVFPNAPLCFQLFFLFFSLERMLGSFFFSPVALAEPATLCQSVPLSRMPESNGPLPMRAHVRERAGCPSPIVRACSSFSVGHTPRNMIFESSGNTGYGHIRCF